MTTIARTATEQAREEWNLVTRLCRQGFVALTPKRPLGILQVGRQPTTTIRKRKANATKSQELHASGAGGNLGCVISRLK